MCTILDDLEKLRDENIKNINVIKNLEREICFELVPFKDYFYYSEGSESYRFSWKGNEIADINFKQKTFSMPYKVSPKTFVNSLREKVTARNNSLVKKIVKLDNLKQLLKE